MIHTFLSTFVTHVVIHFPVYWLSMAHIPTFIWMDCAIGSPVSLVHISILYHTLSMRFPVPWLVLDTLLRHIFSRPISPQQSKGHGAKPDPTIHPMGWATVHELLATSPSRDFRSKCLLSCGLGNIYLQRSLGTAGSSGFDRKNVQHSGGWPSGNKCYIAMENGHRHSEFPHWKWWFSIDYISFPEGKPPFSSGFPMILPFSYGFSEGSQRLYMTHPSKTQWLAAASECKTHSQQRRQNEAVRYGLQPTYIYIYICIHIRIFMYMYVYVHVWICGRNPM